MFACIDADSTPGRGREGRVTRFRTMGVGLLCCVLGMAQRGGMGPRIELIPQFDKDGDGRLNTAERKLAREYVNGLPRRGGRVFGGGSTAPGRPGLKLSPDRVRLYGAEPLYDMPVLRTLFLEFESPDWENELADFWHSDVDVPARLTVDNKAYPDVGVHFRGQTSFRSVPAGSKRSLGVSLDFVHGDQRLYGYRTLNLLNANSDPTFLRTALYHYVARQYIAAPKANFVRVVINGENWGIYVNTQQINGDLTNEWFRTSKGARWKVPGSPNARGGLAYVGDDPASYKGNYEIKSKDDPKAWADLIRLCKVLNQTPPERLVQELAPLLDVDEALKFLAVDKALINNDGYWTRASDYGIYEEPNGRFHLIPWDANETLREPEMMGRGFSGGGGEGADLDPFAGSTDPQKALLYRLLAVPALRTRYLAYLRDIAEKWLDWNRMSPMLRTWQSLIYNDVAVDTRKLYPTEDFARTLTEDRPAGYGFSAPPAMSLKSFMEQRRAYLLRYSAGQKVAAR
jgi:hypothetical protein